jgi:hypothetical protein
MPGQVWGVAAPDTAGPIFVTSYDDRNLSNTVLVAVDPCGTMLWRHVFAGHPRPPRVSAPGTVWIVHGPACQTFTEVSGDGTVLRSVVAEREDHEHLGAVVLLPDGFCIT